MLLTSFSHGKKVYYCTYTLFIILYFHSMKIPETLSTKSVIIWFLIFILLIGWAVRPSLLEEHENGWNREWYHSKEEMRNNGGKRWDSQRQDEEQASDFQDSEGENDNVTPQRWENQNTGSMMQSTAVAGALPVSTLTGVTSSGINQAPQR